MTWEIHDYRGSAHAHVMRIRSYISQLDNNNTCVSDFGFGLACDMKNKFFYRHYVILLYDYCIEKNIAK